MEDDNIDSYQPHSPDDYAVEQQGIMAALQEASGSDDAYRYKALDEQMKSATAARANAMKIAQLQASTSKYGIDATTQNEIRRLKENARQFDASHGLEIAKAYTAFASTPDLMWAKDDFMSAMGRVGQGLSPSPISQNPNQPHAKTYEDFSALAQYNGSMVPGASSGGSSQAASANGGGGGNGEGPDPRVQAANSIMKAIPPSDSQGHTDQDFAALGAIQNVFFAGKPGMQKLGASRMKTGLAGMARLGFDPNLVMEEYNRGLPGQKSPMLA